MRILLTGADGFVAKNLNVRLQEMKDFEVVHFTRKNSPQELFEIVKNIDFVFHLAGVNRPTDEIEFRIGNVDLTKTLVEAIKASGKRIPIVFTSSIQAVKDNPYGRSKLEAEELLKSIRELVPVYIFRLPNVFGKWCKPNYNSVVATFSYNIVNNIPITVNDANASINLIYVDDVINNITEPMFAFRKGEEMAGGMLPVSNIFHITVGELADKLKAYKKSRDNLIAEAVGGGFDRALYSTFQSYYCPPNFTYNLKRYSDPRGVFVEFFKTKTAGQFSFFTAGKGVTRGGHYHHTKTEKFLVLQGKAKFKFRNILTGEKFDLVVSGQESTVVEIIPGWAHDITNIGDDELIVMLWANEIFDREKPDTVTSEV